MTAAAVDWSALPPPQPLPDVDTEPFWQATAEGRHLREVLAALPEVRAALDDEALASLFLPENYLGEAGSFVDAVLSKRA